MHFIVELLADSMKKILPSKEIEHLKGNQFLSILLRSMIVKFENPITPNM